MVRKLSLLFALAIAASTQVCAMNGHTQWEHQFQEEFGALKREIAALKEERAALDLASEDDDDLGPELPSYQPWDPLQKRAPLLWEPQQAPMKPASPTFSPLEESPVKREIRVTPAAVLTEDESMPYLGSPGAESPTLSLAGTDSTQASPTPSLLVHDNGDDMEDEICSSDERERISALQTLIARRKNQLFYDWPQSGRVGISRLKESEIKQAFWQFENELHRLLPELTPIRTGEEPQLSYGYNLLRLQVVRATDALQRLQAGENVSNLGLWKLGFRGREQAADRALKIDYWPYSYEPQRP